VRHEREKFILCPVCEGRGVTVNPSIDAHGLTRADFAEDPEFERDYFSGMYDITCRACNGKRVVTRNRLQVLKQHAEEREQAAQEDGNWEEYQGAHDWRFG
jgi:predicted methyltransferase